METYLDFCIRRDGPRTKGGYFGIGRTQSLDLIEGEVDHSMEGGLSAALGELDNPAREACWWFSIPKVGPPLQHYPLEWICWTNGSPRANILFLAKEYEGKKGEAPNENQIFWSIRITLAIRALCKNYGSVPFKRKVNAWEHNEMVAFGARWTECPSGRMNTVWPRLEAAANWPSTTEDEMAQVIRFPGSPDTYYYVGGGYRILGGPTNPWYGVPLVTIGDAGAPTASQVLAIPSLEELVVRSSKEAVRQGTSRTADNF